MHTNKRTDELSQAQQRPMSLSTQLHLSVLKQVFFYVIPGILRIFIK